MIIRTIPVGPLEANCFIIADEVSKKAIIIDPGDEPDRIMEIIGSEGFSVKYILCTHAHFDHIGAVPDIKGLTDADVILHKDDIDLYHGAADQAALWGYDLPPLPEPDILVEEGDMITVGKLKFNVLHTPGHSPGSFCLFGEDIVVTGDTLFAGAVGRTDFYGGDMNKLKSSFERLMALPPSTEVLPGHGLNTTIGRERSDNFFLKLFT